MVQETDHIIDCEEEQAIEDNDENNRNNVGIQLPTDVGSIRSISSNPDRAESKEVSQLSALIMTVNVTIGAGLLAIPVSLQNSGLITGLVIQALIVVLVIGTCIMLTRLTAHSRANSYHALMQIYGNNTLFNACNTFVLLLTFGTAVAFPVIIGDQFDRVYATLYGNNFCHTWYLSRSFTMTITTIFLIGPLCFSKSIGFLKYASFLGTITIGFISYVVVNEFLTHSNEQPKLPVNYYPDNWTDAFSVVPCLCFAYQCHLSWVPTAASLPARDKNKSCLTVAVAMVISSIVYTAIGTCALLTFGGSIDDDLMENFSERTPTVILAILLLAFKCILTFPLAIFPARISTNDALCASWPRFSSWDERWRRCSISATWLILSLLISLYVPSFLIVIDILGSLAAIFVFVFPAIAWMNYVLNPKKILQSYQYGEEEPVKHGKDRFYKKVQILICIMYIVFGSFVFGFILSEAIEKIMHTRPTNASICI